jgi:hypothetical protein
VEDESRRSGVKLDNGWARGQARKAATIGRSRQPHPSAGLGQGDDDWANGKSSRSCGFRCQASGLAKYNFRVRDPGARWGHVRSTGTNRPWATGSVIAGRDGARVLASSESQRPRRGEEAHYSTAPWHARQCDGDGEGASNEVTRPMFYTAATSDMLAINTRSGGDV